MIQFQQLLSLLALAPVAWAKFSSPDVENGAKPAWTVGDRQVVAWDSSDNHADEVNVTLWQQFPVGEGAKNIALVYSSSDRETQVSELDWIVQPYGANLGFSAEFFFWANRGAVEGGFTSTFFNISRSDDDGNEPTATATPSASATSTSTSTDSDDDSSTGLTSTDKIALGVGIGVGIPILAALAVLIWLKVHGDAAAAAAAAAASNSNTQLDAGVGAGAGAGAGAYCPPPAELEQPPPVPKEVPGSPVYYH